MGHRRNNNFDLLRLVAAAAVLYSHSFALTGHIEPRFGSYTIGTLAVFVFFSVSGYLIVGSWSHGPRLGSFLAKRALRIVPAYLAMLLLVAAVFGPLISTDSLTTYFASGLPSHFVLVNLTFPPQLELLLPGVFTHLPYNEVNGSIWTLPFELRAYALVAVIGLAGGLRDRRVGIAALAVVIVGTALVTNNADLWNPMLLRMFAFGGIIWLLGERLPLSWSLAALVCATWLLLSGTALDNWASALAIPYTAVVAAHRTPLKWSRLTRWGDFSYGLYLWGWVVQQTTVSLLPGISTAEMFCVALPIAYGLGVASWFTVERPMLMLKPSENPRADHAAILSAQVSSAAVGQGEALNQ